MTNWDGLNRRKFPRANYPCLIIIRHNQADIEALLTHTENIGVGGVCIMLKKGLKPFIPVELEIDLLDTSPHIKCEGKIVWSVKRTSADEKKPVFYDTGIEFVALNPKDKERFQRIIAHLVKGNNEAPSP